MDAVDRLTPDYLDKAEADLKEIRSSLRKSVVAGEYRDRKAVIHCHTSLSHDSQGSIDEITRAARATGTDLVMVTDHTRRDMDVIGDGFSGRKSGVLFVPGAEVRNLLLFFADGVDYSKPQRDLISDVRDAGGMVFLSHLEGQTDWGLKGLHGTEIYNLHACFKMQKRLSTIFRPTSISGMQSLLDTLLLLHSHPDTGFATLCEVPHDYLCHWDRLSADSRITGIAANDSHANNTVTIRKNQMGGFVMMDHYGAPMGRIPSHVRLPDFISQEGLVFRPDSYEVSFGHVGTHLLMRRLNLESLVDCLSKGRCYVGFDWIADPSGFSFIWETDRDRGTMGEDVKLRERPVLIATVPTKAKLVLKMNGRTAMELSSDLVEFHPTSPGNYRLEAYMRVAGEMRPWIYSNPIDVRG